jgi:hypothetical protein
MTRNLVRDVYHPKAWCSKENIDHGVQKSEVEPHEPSAATSTSWIARLGVATTPVSTSLLFHISRRRWGDHEVTYFGLCLWLHMVIRS